MLGTLKKVGAPRADVIEGYILSPPRLKEIGQAEDEYCRRYMAMIGASIRDLPDKLAAVVVTSAKEDILYGKLGYGGTVFTIWALAAANQPFLTYLSLRVKHGDKVTMAGVEAFYEQGDQDAISEATLELWGYLEPPPKKDEGQSSPPSPSTGPQSSDVSAVTTKADAA